VLTEVAAVSVVLTADDGVDVIAAATRTEIIRGVAWNMPTPC
jgi:hypothetical protein